MPKLRVRPPCVYILTAITDAGNVPVDAFASKQDALAALAALGRAEETHGRMPTVKRYEVVTRLASGT